MHIDLSLFGALVLKEFGITKDLLDCIKKRYVNLYLIEDLKYFSIYALLLLLGLFKNSVVGLCTCSADLSSEVDGVELEGVDV